MSKLTLIIEKEELIEVEKMKLTSIGFGNINLG